MSSTITGIVASPRREGRFDVVVDGKHAATLALEAVERLGLNVGRAVTPELEGAIAREARVVATLDRALDMLASRARSTRELRRQLIRKGEPPELVALAVERLTGMGLLDDASYARQLARSRMAGSGHSRRRVRAELFRKGVDRELSDEAIAAVVDEEAVDEDANLERVARKKLATLRALDPPTRRRRLYAFLARRGYDGDRIAAVLARLTGRDDAEDASD
jgi:regulatory protein